MTLSVACQKGGVGKTTLSLHLARGLAKLHGKKVLLIDMDSQANASRNLLPNYSKLDLEADTMWRTIIDGKTLPIHESSVQGLYVSPSTIALSEADIHLATSSDVMYEMPTMKVRKQIDKVREDFDHVIIDCPPALSYLTLNALIASERVLVPIIPGDFELQAIQQITRTIRNIQDKVNPDLELTGYVLNRNDQTNATKVTIEAMKRMAGEKFLNVYINSNTAIRDALMRKTDIFDFKPNAQAAGDFKRLIKKVYGYE